MKEDLKEKIREFYARSGVNILLLIGIAGVFLLSFDSDLKKEDSGIDSDIKLEKYQENLEEEMENMLSMVSGAGDVKVMITFESGREKVYVTQEKTTSDEKDEDSYNNSSRRSTYENEIVLISSGSDKTALVEKTLEPAVQGVVVVCTGADDIKVASDITNAVSVAMNITTNRICVIKMD